MFGAALGGLLTLAIHPVSRPYLTEALDHKKPLKPSYLQAIEAKVPPPTDVVSAGAWMQVAAEKLVNHVPLSAKELQTLLAIDHEADGCEPDNAFWPQMEAVLLNEMHQPKEAELAWIRASNRTVWNDQQTPRLLETQQKISHDFGWNEGWTYGFVYFGRSDAAAAVIQKYASKLAGQTDLDNRAGLELRYATLENGSLLRDGSRSIKVGLHGYDMVERASYSQKLLAAYPLNLSPDLKTKPLKRIWSAETALTAKLRQEGMTDEARKTFEAFGNNDAWRALTGTAFPSGIKEAGSKFDLWHTINRDQSPEDNIRSLCLLSVMLAGLPGTILVSSLFGLCLMGIGGLIDRKSESSHGVLPMVGAAWGLAVGFMVFFATGLWIAGSVVSIAVAFLVVGPKTPRKRRFDDLGPLYSMLVATLWMVVFCTFCAFVLAISTAAQSLAPMLGPAGEYIQNSHLFLAVTCIDFSLVCVVAPLYAIVRRFSTPDMLALTIRRIGKMGAIMSLTFCLIGWPLTVYADRFCTNQLKELVENEPIYYLVSP
jgi:hypothetical protein